MRDAMKCVYTLCSIAGVWLVPHAWGSDVQIYVGIRFSKGVVRSGFQQRWVDLSVETIIRQYVRYPSLGCYAKQSGSPDGSASSLYLNLRLGAASKPG